MAVGEQGIHGDPQPHALRQGLGSKGGNQVPFSALPNTWLDFKRYIQGKIKCFLKHILINGNHNVGGGFLYSVQRYFTKRKLRDKEIDARNE